MSEEVRARLAEIHEREQRATDGPWKAHVKPGFFDIVADDFDPAKRYPHDTPIAAMLLRGQIGQRNWDGEFIAAARADVPYLLGVAEAARVFLDEWDGGDGGDAGTCDAANALREALAARGEA